MGGCGTPHDAPGRTPRFALTKMTKIKPARTRRTGQKPVTECPGCGALHALIDRLTIAVERLEDATAPQTEPADLTNPYGIPDTEKE